MITFNNSFFLIPLFIVAFTAAAFANGMEKLAHQPTTFGEHNAKQNEVQSAVHEGHDKNENQPKSQLKNDIPSPPKPHAQPVLSPSQESPSKGWPPKHANRGNVAADKMDSPTEVGSLKKPMTQRKPMTFSEFSPLPEMKTADALQDIPEDEEMVTDDFVGGLHHVPTLDILTHEVNKHDAMLKSIQDQNGATHRLATNANNSIKKYQAANMAEYKTLRNYTNRIYKGLDETQQNMRNFNNEYEKTADSHNKLKQKYDKFILDDKQVKDGIHSKLSTYESDIGTLQTGLGAERLRIDSANRKHGELKTAHDKLSSHVTKVVENKFKTQENQLKDNREQMAKMVNEDKRLDGEIQEVENRRKEFEEKTFAEHVKGTEGKFTAANGRMDGLDATATKLGNEQKEHGDKIEGLQVYMDNHAVVAQNHKRKLKSRKDEIRNVRTKVMSVPNLLDALILGSNAISNKIMDLDEKLPKILVQGQKKMTEATRAFLRANEEAAEVARKNQEKVLEAEKALVEANEQNEKNIQDFLTQFTSERSKYISPMQTKQEQMVKDQIAINLNEEKYHQAQRAGRKQDRKATKEAPAA